MFFILYIFIYAATHRRCSSVCCQSSSLCHLSSTHHLQRRTKILSIHPCYLEHLLFILLRVLFLSKCAYSRKEVNTHYQRWLPTVCSQQLEAMKRLCCLLFGVCAEKFLWVLTFYIVITCCHNNSFILWTKGLCCQCPHTHNILGGEQWHTFTVTEHSKFGALPNLFGNLCDE